MLMKIKKKWLAVGMVSLSIAVSQVNASGIPVVDGALNMMTQIENQLSQQHRLSTVAQWAKDVAHYKSIISNWTKNFQEMVRGKFGNLRGVKFKPNDPYTQNEYIELLAKLQKQCNKISNSESKKLCINVINIDKEKVNLFYSSMEDIDSATAELNEAIQNQRAQSRSGQAQTAENEVQIKLDNLKKIMDRYEFQLKILNTKQEFMQKARADIAREQINGTNPNIINAISQAATAGNLQTKTNSFRRQAEELRGDANTPGSSTYNADTFLNKKVLQ